MPIALSWRAKADRCNRIAAAILGRRKPAKRLEVEDRAFLVGEAQIGTTEQGDDAREAGIIGHIVIGPDHVAARREGEAVRHAIGGLGGARMEQENACNRGEDFSRHDALPFLRPGRDNTLEQARTGKRAKYPRAKENPPPSTVAGLHILYVTAISAY